MVPQDQNDTSLNVIGLFSGIGGLELGLKHAGHRILGLCEIDEQARMILEKKFPNINIEKDVRNLVNIPSETNLISAGFPCQDLSPAGNTAGIYGSQSSIVKELFRLLAINNVPWVLIENVPFMLHLDKGRAMEYIAGELENLGYNWAYRVINTQAFGIPQRRKRVYMLASNKLDPRDVLLCGNEKISKLFKKKGIACGFYWTEGFNGLGWANDAIPTIKGGSTIGIPSSPAIWRPRMKNAADLIATLDIRDAERLQGFPSDWTLLKKSENGKYRWKLIGNAASVPVVKWIGLNLRYPKKYDFSTDVPLTDKKWPLAAWSVDKERYISKVSDIPVKCKYSHLEDFLQNPLIPLSGRATIGFYNRTCKSTLQFSSKFLRDLKEHIPNVCPLCDKSFFYKKALATHFEKKHYRVNSTRACPICAKMFKYSNALEIHMQKKHYNQALSTIA